MKCKQEIINIYRDDSKTCDGEIICDVYTIYPSKREPELYFKCDTCDHVYTGYDLARLINRVLEGLP